MVNGIVAIDIIPRRVSPVLPRVPAQAPVRRHRLTPQTVALRSEKQRIGVE